MRLAGDLLAFRQDRLGIRQGDRGRPALVPLHHPGHQLVGQLPVFLVQGIPLRLADLLDHDLFGGLGGHALRDFLGRQRHAIVGAGDRAVLAIDLQHDVLVFPVVLLGGRNQRCLDALEDDLFIDVLFAVDRVYDPQQFAGVHRFLSSLTRGDSRARTTSTQGDTSTHHARSWDAPRRRQSIRTPTLTPAPRKKTGTKVAQKPHRCRNSAGSATA